MCVKNCMDNNMYNTFLQITSLIIKNKNFLIFDNMIILLISNQKIIVQYIYL
jgi:hypothetical protein